MDLSSFRCINLSLFLWFYLFFLSIYVFAINVSTGKIVFFCNKVRPITRLISLLEISKVPITMRLYSHFYWLAIFLTPNSRQVLFKFHLSMPHLSANVAFSISPLSLHASWRFYLGCFDVVSDEESTRSVSPGPQDIANQSEMVEKVVTCDARSIQSPSMTLSSLLNSLSLYVYLSLSR